MTASKFPCPICKKEVFILGKDKKGNSVASCSHSFHFAKTKAKKLMDRRYISYPWGLELAEEK
jgi:hypothetical protein